MDNIKPYLKNLKTGRRVVLPEGSDPRIVKAARRLLDESIARPILLGKTDEIINAARRESCALDGIELIDPADAPTEMIENFSEAYVAGRPGTRDGVARRLMRKPLFFAGMLVKNGGADAFVAGVSHPTARVIEAGLMTIGLAPGINTPSSYFLMLVPGFRGAPHSPLIFADCAVNIDPDSEQLADIALASASSAAHLLNDTPKVALLSFSTRGSARHVRVDKITDALDIIRRRAPELAVDGELQADSALIETVAKAKVRADSTVAGHANVLIFPDLDAGNIAYKLTQYLADAIAIGPFLQGFSRPVSDLSRGASVDDIIAAAAITLASAD
ncbi:MAG: phosphotransacetylase [marine bacterium B5-7]|nr:MAG: phosphotransacetylase [marine bacterium B5-7]